ncbi:sugar phosphate isomerase/epimerase family protein [Aquisphaera insulae]|uniref:sugar phosphate isomerase/epimerase family protein n=1 Tax=Aquisphaera insulae TaxID=2712864 RepID=UPI0013ED800B|nr:TIM barrel protein [Aquisphaera insulae]
MFASWNARAVGLSQSARSAIDLAASCGFDGVDLLVRDLDQGGEDPVELRARMDDLGLRGGAWPLPVMWKGDESRFLDDLRMLPRYARIAAVLGLTCTGTWVLPEVLTDGEGGSSAVDQRRRTTEFHLDRLGRVARILEDHGSRLGLEVLGPISARSGTLPEFVCSYQQLCDRLAGLRERHENVGLLVDAFHLYAAGEGIEAGLSWGIDRVVWVHISEPLHPDRHRLLDEQRTLPNAADPAKCRDLLLLLDRLGFNGPVTVEPLSRCDAIRDLDARQMAARVSASLSSVWPHARPGPES